MNKETPISFGLDPTFNAEWSTFKGYFNSPLEPGSADWKTNFEGKINSLVFVCPCGCRDIVFLPVQQGRGNSWEWDGNMEKPTLNPSILRTTGCRWHGYLTGGVFKECP